MYVLYVCVSTEKVRGGNYTRFSRHRSKGKQLYQAPHMMIACLIVAKCVQSCTTLTTTTEQIDAVVQDHNIHSLAHNNATVRCAAPPWRVCVHS